MKFSSSWEISSTLRLAIQAYRSSRSAKTSSVMQSKLISFAFDVEGVSTLDVVALVDHRHECLAQHEWYVVVLVVVGELLRRQAGLAFQVSEQLDHRALLDEPSGFDAGFIVEASPAGPPGCERRGRPRILRVGRSRAGCASGGC